MIPGPRVTIAASCAVCPYERAVTVGMYGAGHVEHACSAPTVMAVNGGEPRVIGADLETPRTCPLLGQAIARAVERLIGGAQ